MSSWKDLLKTNGTGNSPIKTASPNPPKIRKFYLNRVEDESGVSGTGVVAVGVEFPSKRCVIEWVSKQTDANSCGIYDTLEDLEKVHGHEGKTEVKFYDEED